MGIISLYSLKLSLRPSSSSSFSKVYILPDALAGIFAAARLHSFSLARPLSVRWDYSSLYSRPKSARLDFLVSSEPSNKSSRVGKSLESSLMMWSRSLMLQCSLAIIKLVKNSSSKNDRSWRSDNDSRNELKCSLDDESVISINSITSSHHDLWFHSLLGSETLKDFLSLTTKKKR